jgi:hypothetical protein
MKFLTAILAIVATFALASCATGIVERTVPAKSCCGEGKCER